MKILGINDHHNSSASLLVDGKIVAAMQEERYTRKKNFWGLPKHSIKSVLDYGGISLKDIDIIAFAGKRQSGHEEFSRARHVELMKQTVQMDLFDAARGHVNISKRKILRRMLHAWAIRKFPSYLHSRELKIMKRERLNLLYKYYPEAKSISHRFIDHHTCHFATAYFGDEGSKNGERLVFTNDGQGDLKCGSVYKVDHKGRGEELSSLVDRDSIAQIWALITLLTGFVPLEHEYKLMGMAPYSASERRDRVAKKFEDLFTWENGQYNLKDDKVIHSFYFRRLVNRLNQLCKFERFDDICGGLQKFTEDALVRWVKYWIDETGIQDICLSGGTFMNVKANMEIMKLPEVKSVFVFPSCSDETNAIGACYQAYYDETDRHPEPLQGMYLGKSWNNEDVQSALSKVDLVSVRVEKHDNIEDFIVKLLVENKVVARFEGREEFGARALGNRSILANPNTWSVISEINDMIKNRDFWMPFACSILAEDQHRYIKNPGKNCGQYMIMCFDGGDEIDQIIAGTHPRDKSIRPQIVYQERSPEYHTLIRKFKDLTGIGAVLNTSFNLHGYPLVHSPEDAIYVFQNSGLKYLALENYLLIKE